MRILGVVRIKSYSRYGYDYLKEITLRKADYQEYTIAEKDFKNLYPSYFEDLNLVLLQVVFPVSNNVRKIMRFNEIYKFSDGTLTNILEALDYRVKEYKVNRLNPDVAIKRTGKLGDSDVNALEDPTLILEILSRRFFLRLNILDHRSDLIGSGVKMEMEIPPSSGVYFINACSYSTHTSKELMKAQVTTNNQAFTIKKGTSMPVQMSQTQDGERPHVDDQRLDLADDLKEAQDHISSSITSHKTKITTSNEGVMGMMVVWCWLRWRRGDEVGEGDVEWRDEVGSGGAWRWGGCWRLWWFRGDVGGGGGGGVDGVAAIMVVGGDGRKPTGDGAGIC
ncbi:hypothetical protein Tco_1036966 [Tanacetum coccineum]